MGLSLNNITLTIIPWQTTGHEFCLTIYMDEAICMWKKQEKAFSKKQNMLLTSNVGTCSVKSAVIFIICSAYISALFLFMCACVSFTPSCLNRMDDIQLCKEITRLKKELHKLVSIPGRSPLGVHDCCYWTKTNKQTNKIMMTYWGIGLFTLLPRTEWVDQFHYHTFGAEASKCLATLA